MYYVIVVDKNLYFGKQKLVFYSYINNKLQAMQLRHTLKKDGNKVWEIRANNAFGSLPKLYAHLCLMLAAIIIYGFCTIHDK